MLKAVLVLACLLVTCRSKPTLKKRSTENIDDVINHLEESLKRHTRDVQLSDLCHNATGYPLSSKPFEKPNDCDHFYQCSNGYLYTMPCAPGTVFNPAIGVCDHPYNVPGCGGTTTTTKTTTTTEKITPPPFDIECLNGTGYPISTDPFEKPGDCDHFYQCSNGYLHTMPCAPGTVFNPAIGVCDHPYNVPGCGGTTTTKKTTTTTEKITPPPFDIECLNATGYPISTDPFEKPGDCDHFYQCSNGYLHTMPCAPGTVFNPAIGVCDWPYNVPSCDGPSSTTTTEATTTTTQKAFDAECLNGTGYPISGDPFEKPGDCDNFYQCSNGYLHTMPCAPGTVFNPAIGVCDWPQNVPGCGGAPEISGSGSGSGEPSCIGPNGEPLSTEPFEKPNDCYHFYQCGAGILYTMDCAEGTVFNPSLSVCDWPSNVPGCP